MNLDYKNILIYGYLKSGQAVEQVLIKQNIPYKIYDDNLKLQGGQYLTKIKPSILKMFDLVVISPGISIYNKVVMLAESLGIKVVSELEFGYWFCKCPIIAVTGTNGKTTTVSLLGHILSEFGLKTQVFGNIGNPLCNIINYKKLDFAVVEVSSFQLEATDKFCADYGILLNIDQDHTDRHKSFENYVKCKIGLFKNPKPNTIAILNADDPVIIKNHKNINTKKVFVSEHSKVQGYFLHNNIFFSNYDDMSEKVVYSYDVLNQQSKTFPINLLCVLSVCDLLGIGQEIIQKALKTFNWLPNRLEFVASINGVEYINDSKATNIHATQGAIMQVNKKCTLLLGGQNKDLNFRDFFCNLSKNVEKIILFGQARNAILKAAKKMVNCDIYCTKWLENAVVLAVKVTPLDRVVLFSPACASFDAYTSYKQRGEHFKWLVNDIKNFLQTKNKIAFYKPVFNVGFTKFKQKNKKTNCFLFSWFLKAKRRLENKVKVITAK